MWHGDLIVCCLDVYAIPANSVIPNFSSAQSFTLLALSLEPILFLPVLAFITLHEYFGGQLKAKCPFFLHLKHVAFEIHSGIDGGLLLSLSGHFESRCPVL